MRAARRLSSPRGGTRATWTPCGVVGLHEVRCEETITGGAVGYGVFEFLCLGLHDPHGVTGPDGGAG